MTGRNPEKNFEILWRTFHDRYPFFALRGVDWQTQYDIYRPQVSRQTSDDELFDIFSAMLAPLNDGHVELVAKIGKPARKRTFNAEQKPRFYREFSDADIKTLFDITSNTLEANGFGRVQDTKAWNLKTCRSADFGYLRILELEGIKKKKVSAAMEKIARDFDDLTGYIIDLRNNPGGDDSMVLAILSHFTDERRVAYHRRTKKAAGPDAFGPLKTFHIEPDGDQHFTGPIVVLTCDAVFSGAECFALAARALPHAQLLGEHTNGIFSYQLEEELPNGFEYFLSYQEYLSPDMICYEGVGVPVDIELLNTRADLKSGTDPLITRALELLSQRTQAGV